MTAGQTVTWTECQWFSSRRRPKQRTRMMRQQQNVEWVWLCYFILKCIELKFMVLICPLLFQGLQRRATPHPSELKVMKKVIEERRNEAYTSRSDENEDQQVHFSKLNYRNDTAVTFSLSFPSRRSGSVTCPIRAMTPRSPIAHCRPPRTRTGSMLLQTLRGRIL